MTRRGAGRAVVGAMAGVLLLALVSCVTGSSVDPTRTSAASATPPWPSRAPSGSGAAAPPTGPAATPPAVSAPPPVATPPGPRGVEMTLPPAGVARTGPTVVLVHGGAWVAGSPDLMDRWAGALAAEGSVVFNASYRLLFAGGGYPESIDDVACAVRYARATASRYTDSDQLVILGHSAGAHLAAVVAFNGAAFGTDCPYPPAAMPDRFVGLAGIYDIANLPLFSAFVGASRADAPDAWRAVDPVELASQRADVDVTLVVAGDDEVVDPGQSDAFAAALAATPGRAPSSIHIEVVNGANHSALLDPTLVGLARVGW